MLTLLLIPEGEFFLTGNSRAGVFYGWVVVAAGFMAPMIAWGLQYSYGVFFASLSAETDSG